MEETENTNKISINIEELKKFQPISVTHFVIRPIQSLQSSQTPYNFLQGV